MLPAATEGDLVGAFTPLSASVCGLCAQLCCQHSFERDLVTSCSPRLSACVPTCSLVELSSTVTGINVDANGITNPLNVYNQTRMPGGGTAGCLWSA